MSVFQFVIVALLLALLLLGFFAGLRFSGGRLSWAVFGSGLAGFGMGAFFGSAAGAMATAVSSAEAFWRGGAIGAGLGIAAGGILALAWWIGRRRSRRTGEDGAY